MLQFCNSYELLDFKNREDLEIEMGFCFYGMGHTCQQWCYNDRC